MSPVFSRGQVSILIIMAQELSIKSYYQSVYDSNIISTNMVCRIGLEFLLSTLLFKGDLSRVVYSKEDIAFRRRVETLGKGDVKEGSYNYINLNLPYAVYSQTGSYEPDDRGSTQQAGQIVLGQTHPDSGIITKAAAVKVKYNATIFFARRDDVNIASQLLYWEQQPKFPVYYVVEHTINGYPIDIPVFMTLESFDSNVDYQEKEWLAKSKIFPIKCEFTIRSYQTLIEQVDNTIKLPIRFSGLYGYNDEEIYFTQNTAIIWSNTKWGPSDDKITKDYAFNRDGMAFLVGEDTNREKVSYENSPYPSAVDEWDSSIQDVFEGTQKRFDKEVIDETVADTINGYFQEDRDCVLDEFHQNMDKTTENKVVFNWKVKEADLPHFKNIVIYIPGLVRDQIDDSGITEFELGDLHPGSKYDCTLIITSKTFSKLTYKLELNTKGEKVLGKTLMSNLVGRQYNFNSEPSQTN